MFVKQIIKSAVIAAFAATTMVVSADDYPSKPIKVIVPNGAGGGTDVTSRLVAKVFQEKLGSPLAIVNMGGGGTSIGAMEAAKSANDGYTILSTHEAFLTSSALGVNSMGPASVTPIAQVAKEVIVLTVSKASPIKNLEEFYAAAKKGHSGDNLTAGVNPGAANHFFFLNGLSPIDHDVTFVPTGGGAKTMKALLGGTIDAGMFEVSAAADAIRSGDIIPIAVFNDVRHPELADVATSYEQGYEVSVGLHYVWYAPAGTPDDRVIKLADALSATINDEEFANTLIKRATTPALITGDALKSTLDQRFAEIQSSAKEYITGQ